MQSISDLRIKTDLEEKSEIRKIILNELIIADKEIKKDAVDILRTEEIVKEFDEEVKREQRKKIKEKHTPIKIIQFKNIKQKALIDTGAQISAIARQVFEKLKKTKQEIEEIPISKFILKGTFSEKGETIGRKAIIKMEIDKKQFVGEFHIVEDMAYKAVLGINFLVKYKMKMQCEEKTTIKLEREEENVQT